MSIDDRHECGGAGENTALVSVIVPSFNRGKLLPSVMESIKSQTYRPIELVVIDDGSTDDSSRVVAAWAEANSDARDFRVLYHRQENQGLAAARNAGFRKSVGEFVVWHDSDDLMLPQRVELAVERIQQTGADACVCGFTSVGHVFGGLSYVPPSSVADPVAAYRTGELHVRQIIWMYRRESLSRTMLWRERIRCGPEDEMFIIDYIFSRPLPRIVTVQEVLCVAVESEDSLAWNSFGTRRQFEDILWYIEEKVKEVEGAHAVDRLYDVLVLRAQESAIYSWGRYPDLSRRFRNCAKRQGRKVIWGRTWAHRLVWRIGGVPACALCIRAKEFCVSLFKGRRSKSQPKGTSVLPSKGNVSCMLDRREGKDDR